LTNIEYAQFASLDKRFGNKLVIFGFPSREYGWQEFDNDNDIAEFAKSKDFPGIMMKLGKIKGETAPEVWKFFKDETGAADPMWNFKGKFLVGKTGNVSVATDLEADIERLVKEEYENEECDEVVQ
jgi:glutathione peroxidase